MEAAAVGEVERVEEGAEQGAEAGEAEVLEVEEAVDKADQPILEQAKGQARQMSALVDLVAARVQSIALENHKCGAVEAWALEADAAQMRWRLRGVMRAADSVEADRRHTAIDSAARVRHAAAEEAPSRGLPRDKSAILPKKD